MSDIIDNEIANQDDIIEKIFNYVERNITDEGIRQFIFGKRGLSWNAICTTSNYIEYIKRVLNLSFFYAYACYKYDLANGEKSDKVSGSNAKRVIKNLSEAYAKTPVTQELVQYVLLDIQFDLELGRDSELKGIFGKMVDMDDGFSFYRYFNIIKKYDTNPGKYQFDDELLFDAFYTLLEKLEFLEKCSLRRDDVDVVTFIDNKSSKEMVLRHVIYRDDSQYAGGFYILFKVQCVDKTEGKNQAIKLVYLSPASSTRISFVHSVDEEALHLAGQKPDEIYYEITCCDWENKKERTKSNEVIERIHTINYKYIKNLALAIADAISGSADAKMALYDKYKNKYSYVFRDEKTNSEKYKSDPYNNPKLDWDTIVVMLLIEESPTKVLEFLFSHAKTLVHVVARNLYERAYNVESLELFNFEGATSEKINEAIRDIIDTIIPGESECYGFNKKSRKSDKLFPRAAAILILSKLSEVQETDYKKKLVYTGNLRSNITWLQNAKDNEEKDKCIRYASLILGETFKHMICFYSGLFAYGNIKAKYDEASCDVCLSDDTVKRFKTDLEEAFITAAVEAANQFTDDYPTKPEKAIELMECFIEFCERCNSSSKITIESKALYRVIGKYEITDVDVLKMYMNMLKSGIINDCECDVDLWINTVLEVLEFLKTGSTFDTPIDSDLFNAVYPFTAVFNRGKENPDGYKTVTFSLNIDVDEDNNTDHSMDVNVLSEFEYESDVYYCLPHVLRSNYKWWIDPVLISFRDFNDIFPNNGKEI